MERRDYSSRKNRHFSASALLSIKCMPGEKRFQQTKKNQIITDPAFLVLNGGGEEIRTLGRD